MARVVLAAVLAVATLINGTPAPAQDNMTTLQAKCVRETNRAYRKLAAVYGAEHARCVKSVRAVGGSYDACIANLEQSRKVQKAQERVRQIADTRCTDTPPFAYSSPDTVIQAAADGEVALVRKTFGADVAAAIKPATAGCQANLLAAMQKCRDTSLGGYNECKQQELQVIEGPDYTRLLADRCIRQGVFSEDRGTGEPRQLFKNCRVAISDALVKGCGISTTAQIAALFPGECSGAFAASNVCLKRVVTCTACRAVDVADALGISGFQDDTCDRVDDGNMNASCAP